ncbi:cell division protein ZapE [Deinococcus wulumuqiensis]|uniref:cell division protein ZapE n=1 Tax=Deinococcus wulumuqiensis TaxID=980427 RepID=UPI0013C2B22C|nr:cell division protein ZapE [Deinococcus wulumuqiensis]
MTPPLYADPFAHPPEGSPADLITHLTPGARFQEVRFENYRPNPQFPSQAQARALLEDFVAQAGRPSGGGGFWPFKRRAPEGRGLYLDGGFGVGKTHLLASAYHAAGGGGDVAFMSFQDLMYLIGALGMPQAIETFRHHKLLLIDEFELDDPGNTHMANTFLGGLMPGGVSVVATSNTEPGALGAGRFNAEDFARQIQGIADRFTPHRVDGPDYRQRGTDAAQPLSDAEFAAWLSRQNPQTTAVLTHEQLNRALLSVHPSRFARVLEQVRGVAVTNLQPMPEQGAALRFVHFVDKVYDLGLHAAFTGAPLETLFDDIYRHGGYAKKYSRALSRLSEMLREARTVGAES